MEIVCAHIFVCPAKYFLNMQNSAPYDNVWQILGTDFIILVDISSSTLVMLRSFTFPVSVSNKTSLKCRYVAFE